MYILSQKMGPKSVTRRLNKEIQTQGRKPNQVLWENRGVRRTCSLEITTSQEDQVRIEKGLGERNKEDRN